MIAGTFGLWCVATLALLFSSHGPDRTLTKTLSVAAAMSCLILCGLWTARRQPEVFGIIGGATVAVGSLSQSQPLIGLGGCLLLAVLNSFSALVHPMRSIVVVMLIATGTAGVLGVELAHRTGDLALSGSVLAVVFAMNIGLPLAVNAMGRTVRREMREIDRDALTGLFNRRAFLRRAADITRMPRDPDDSLVVVMIDVDDFKNVNDTAGHAAGDKVLIAVANTLRDQCSVAAVISRYGGEEFAIAGILSDDEASELAEKLCQQLGAISSPVPVTASIGWSSVSLRSIALDGESQAIGALVVRADSAMYAAKRNGGNQVRHRPAPLLGAADDLPFDVWLQQSTQLIEGRVTQRKADGTETRDRRLDAAVAGVGLQSVFQPIVSLADEAVIGFEVLTRWPQLGDPHPPDVLAQAESTGRTDELEHRCIESALRCALRAGVGRDSWLFINTESSAATAELISGHDGARLVFELTERHLLEHPGELLRKVDGLRSRTCSIALDDVGAQRDSLALLDVVGPDIIKLHPDLIQQGPSKDNVRTLAAVLAHRQRTRATILVEGIETAEQLERARAIGATLGQGYWFGRPTLAPDWRGREVPWSPEPMEYPPKVGASTPFDIVALSAPVRTERRATLVALSRYIESQAVIAANPPIVLAAFQHADHFTAATRSRYRRIAAAAPFVGVFGEDLPGDLGPNIRSVPLDHADPLTAEWIVVVLGPDTATALIAREERDRPRRGWSGGDRYFATALTNDRHLVTMAARSLLGRIL